MTIAFGMICAGILPMPLVYLLRRFQVLKVDLDIHQGSIRRNETTASTKEMIDQDDDVSFIAVCPNLIFSLKLFKNKNFFMSLILIFSLRYQKISLLCVLLLKDKINNVVFSY